MRQSVWKTAPTNRRYFIGGSDARVIMGNDESALVRLWREKRGEVEPGTFRATSWSSLASPPRS
jgi:predicted phage-related endonuclease